MAVNDSDSIIPFMVLLHAHDHVWRSDWPYAVRVAACWIFNERFNPTVKINKLTDDEIPYKENTDVGT